MIFETPFGKVDLTPCEWHSYRVWLRILTYQTRDLITSARIFKFFREHGLFETRIRFGRREYHIPEVFYRTQLMVEYVGAVGDTTPEPFLELRVVAVSNKPKRYSLEEFKKVIIQMEQLLSHFAGRDYENWRRSVKAIIVEGTEEDEPIDPDEALLSLPEYKRINYAERYAEFLQKGVTYLESWFKKAEIDTNFAYGRFNNELGILEGYVPPTKEFHEEE